MPRIVFLSLGQLLRPRPKTAIHFWKSLKVVCLPIDPRVDIIVIFGRVEPCQSRAIFIHCAAAGAEECSYTLI